MNFSGSRPKCHFKWTNMQRLRKQGGLWWFWRGQTGANVTNVLVVVDMLATTVNIFPGRYQRLNTESVASYFWFCSDGFMIDTVCWLMEKYSEKGSAKQAQAAWSLPSGGTAENLHQWLVSCRDGTRSSTKYLHSEYLRISPGSSAGPFPGVGEEIYTPIVLGDLNLVTSVSEEKM